MELEHSLGRLRLTFNEGKVNMAEVKIKPITDSRIITEVKAIQGDKPETKQWTPEHQMKLIWNLFRTNPAMKYAAMTAEEKKKSYQQWVADWNNGRLAYPSNTARSLAEAGLARKDVASEFQADADIK